MQDPFIERLRHLYETGRGYTVELTNFRSADDAR